MQRVALYCAFVVSVAGLVGACAPSAPPRVPAPAVEPASSGPPAASSTAAAPAAVFTGPSAASEPLNPPVTVRMGVLGIIAEAGAYIAAERGYFAEEGLVPEFIAVDVGARSIPLLATGQLDASGGSFSPGFVQAVQRGVNIKMAAGLSINPPDRSSGAMLVRKALMDEGVVREWSDLRGMRVAMPARGTVGDYAVWRALALGGLTLADIELVELPFPDMIPAFGNGRIDAAHSAEPLTTLAVERGVAAKFRLSGEYLPWSSSALLTYGPTLLDQQPEAGRRWLVAILRGARDYLGAFDRGDRRAEVVEVLTKHTSVKDATLYDRIAISQLEPNGAINLAELAAQAAFWAQEGFLPGPVDVAPLEDSRFRDAALARLGRSSD